MAPRSLSLGQATQKLGRWSSECAVPTCSAMPAPGDPLPHALRARPGRTRRLAAPPGTQPRGEPSEHWEGDVHEPRTGGVSPGSHRLGLHGLRGRRLGRNQVAVGLAFVKDLPETVWGPGWYPKTTEGSGGTTDTLRGDLTGSELRSREPRERPRHPAAQGVTGGSTSPPPDLAAITPGVGDGTEGGFCPRPTGGTAFPQTQPDLGPHRAAPARGWPHMCGLHPSRAWGVSRGRAPREPSHTWPWDQDFQGLCHAVATGGSSPRPQEVAGRTGMGHGDGRPVGQRHGLGSRLQARTRLGGEEGGEEGVRGTGP